MAHAAITEHFAASFRARRQAIHHVERQDRRQLLHRPRMITADTGDVRQQTARTRRYTQTCHLRDHFNRLAHDRGVERPLWSSYNFSELIGLSRREEMCALKFELFAHRLLDRCVANYSLL